MKIIGPGEGGGEKTQEQEQSVDVSNERASRELMAVGVSDHAEEG